MISDSFSFVNELLNLNINSYDFIKVSFDIKSLFTNIPLDKTITIIVNELFHYVNWFYSFYSISESSSGIMKW